jgi:hypothetical protein
MQQHMDPSLLSDVATILLDCGLRPGPRWENRDSLRQDR